MPDIAKCKGDDCTLKESCHRYLAKPSMYQSYFVTPPFEEKDGKQNCEFYWEVKTEKNEISSRTNI